MITRKYNLVNNVTGWVIFVIALVTYWLTLEPTASYWDCGEFIIQADKLEIGHPPGNPIFMLTARFFANFAPDAAHVSVMVNAMSGLLSALTILLLFWTITHLVRRLVVRDDSEKELSLANYLVIMGSGVVGALAYCWSDTFWFSAVEGEVYAFSSFCTALVFWLILKWENRADSPGSDRYLILIAYIIGVSIAVHLLNLLCIPAIVLVFVFRRWKNVSAGKAVAALCVSFLIVALVLFGMVPGFIKMAQQFELLFVNGLHCSFNTGALVYAFLTLAMFVWALYELQREKSGTLIRISFFLAVLVSGMLFIGSGWWLGWVLTALLAAWLWLPGFRPLPVRVLNVAMWSIAVIFIGYSSYALILIRSTADTPMNQNSPDNVFDLAAYLNREQYGETPLLYGETINSSTMRRLTHSGTDTLGVSDDGQLYLTPNYTSANIVEKGKPLYVKGVRNAVPRSAEGLLTRDDSLDNNARATRGGDYYVKKDYKAEYRMNPELDMVFPRIYSRMHRQYYPTWVSMDTTPANLKEISAIDGATGRKIPEPDYSAQPYSTQMPGYINVNYPAKTVWRPTYGQNLEYFLNYQLNHMYWRYFLWNFAGRQNDVLNQQGELDAGNWISGIPAWDNARLGDQSQLPDDLGKNNKGHNVYYMLPLLLGIIGLLWQAFAGQRGIEQFWVVFFLFFMTGIAIVLYLNQPPMQPRERDYAFAGSFYAFAIWIGMGVAGLRWLLVKLMKSRDARIPAGIAALLGLLVPIQMVSQTWDDHDRSGRYAARDFAINYLESLEPNAIVFCNGDNDTFPLWYVQEVEGVRPDVKIVNLSYLASDWYANQMRQQSYDAKPVHFTAKPEDIAYGRLDVVIPGQEKAPADLLQSLRELYANPVVDPLYNYPRLKTSVVTVPVNKKAVIERGLVAPQDSDRIVDEIVIDLANAPAVASKGYVSLSELLMLDIIATNAAEGWPRPIYWCSTVGTEYHLGMSDYMMSTGMTHQLVPTLQPGLPARTDRAYNVVTDKYRWGGADTDGRAPYYDETARRMLTSVRNSMIDVCTALIAEGDILRDGGDTANANAKYRAALKTANLMESKLPERTATYNVTVALTMPEIYGQLADRLGDKKLRAKAVAVLKTQMTRMAQYLRYSAVMATSFGNVSLTPESRLIPYQFYRFIELYSQYGGDMKWVQALVTSTGYSVEQLKQLYDHAYGVGGYDDYYGTEGGSGDDYTQYVNELAEVARTVNRLAGLSDEQYAATSDDDRQLDSIFYGALEQYVQFGVPRELIEANADVRRVDMTRSKRVYEEWAAKHPN